MRIKRFAILEEDRLSLFLFLLRFIIIKWSFTRFHNKRNNKKMFCDGRKWQKLRYLESSFVLFNEKETYVA